MLQIILFTFVIILSWFNWKQYFTKHAKMINAFPGPRAYPVLGNLIGISIKQDILFKQVRDIIKPFNQTFRTWNSSLIAALNVVTADDAEIILSQTQVEKGFLYLLFKPWLKNGLLTSKGNHWHERRKMLNTAFNYNILRKFVDVFAVHSNTCIETIKNQNGGKINVVPLISQIALSSICETSMGIKVDPKDAEQKEYFECLHKVAPFFIERTFCPWLLPDFIYSRTKIYENFQKVLNVLKVFSGRIIREREENYHEDDGKAFDENYNAEFGDHVFKKKSALLDLLIARKKCGNIDDAGIQEEVDTFIFAGHDTTAVTACYALMLLANHKEIQEKAIAEVDEIFGDSPHPATYEDLQNMKYLDRVIKETLRLYPSVPAISRRFNEDTKLTHHIAPANTEIFIHIYDIHRDPKVYPDPEKFDPDRFLPENSKGRNRYAYIPFSSGPRNCIGQKFATLELKTIISSVLRHFTLDPVDSAQDIILMVDLVLRMKEALYIKFIPRY